MRQLSRFAITVRGDDFVLHIEDEAGEKMEFCATPDQLDAVIDALDEVLSGSEDDFFGGQGPGAQRAH
ncbi:hypothetical protein [Phenylobacterium sp.]|uniref:hypothetical protein n=1 Tax=Phenylobacterium sp. TaxID=1871053 RepID=UPI002DF1C9C3|nr:hypothetical protein [Phenylobacterium sp.]